MAPTVFATTRSGVMMRRLLLPALSVVALAGCATVPRLRAADDVHALLVAVRDGDKPAFEAHVDRPTLKTQLKSRLIAEAGRRGGAWGMFGVGLVGPLVDVGVDVLVQPDVFRAEAIRLGYDPQTPIPGPLKIAALIKPMGEGRACVQEYRGGACVLVFRDVGGVYRLSAYEGPLDRLAGPRLKPR